MNKFFTTWFWIDQLNKNKLTSNLYVFLKKYIKKGDFKVSNLKKITPLQSTEEKIRINIILPSLRKSKVFGGINTALHFFDLILQHGNFDGRIIVIGNEKYDSNLTVDIDRVIKQKNIKIQFTNDSTYVDVRKNDFFIYTTWKSAYIFEKVLEWQRENYKVNSRCSIYFIQDYEPGFVAWSSEFALAESTYHTNSDCKIAVFNSKELYDYFKFNKYSFKKEYFFTPSLNEKLANNLPLNSNKYARKKNIIFYGRPNEPRNAYELIIETLKLWSEQYHDSKTWSIYSIGAPTKDVKLKNNTIVSKGKLSLDEYSEIMLTSSVGISLMISPHPSYPPLEMSTFGVKTITNKFMNKDLSHYNSNLYVVPECSPEVMCKQLISLCDNFDKYSNIDINPDYINENDFIDCAKSVVTYIENVNL